MAVFGLNFNLDPDLDLDLGSLTTPEPEDDRQCPVTELNQEQLTQFVEEMGSSQRGYLFPKGIFNLFNFHFQLDRFGANRKVWGQWPTLFTVDSSLLGEDGQQALVAETAPPDPQTQRGQATERETGDLATCEYSSYTKDTNISRQHPEGTADDLARAKGNIGDIPREENSRGNNSRANTRSPAGLLFASVAIPSRTGGLLCYTDVYGNISTQTDTDVYDKMSPHTDVYDKMSPHTDVYDKMPSHTDVYDKMSPHTNSPSKATTQQSITRHLQRLTAWLQSLQPEREDVQKDRDPSAVDVYVTVYTNTKEEEDVLVGTMTRACGSWRAVHVSDSAHEMHYFLQDFKTQGKR